MTQEYKDKIGIPDTHSLVLISTDSKVKKGVDTDIYVYEELDSNGVKINSYTISDSTSMYPPFNRTIRWE